MIGIMTALKLRKLLKNKKINVNSPASFMNVGEETKTPEKTNNLMSMLSTLLEGDPVDDEFVKHFGKH